MFGELGAEDSAGRWVTVRATSETCLATLDYPALDALTAADPTLGCALLRAIIAHAMRRLRTATTKIETLNEINNALKEEWSAEVKSDKDTIARLSVLMKLERQAGLRSRLGDDRVGIKKRA
jgi:CRP-like cAMP-binding protein